MIALRAYNSTYILLDGLVFPVAGNNWTDWVIMISSSLDEVDKTDAGVLLRNKRVSPY